MSSAGQDTQFLIQSIDDGIAVRYITLIGVVMLLYDHTLTFTEEVRCIWKAPNSFPKFAFLLNRYLVPCGLIPVLYETCGFNGAVYGDKGCRILLSTISMISVLSICLANALVLLRVLILWSESKFMRYALYTMYAIGSAGTLSMMILTVITLGPEIRWSSTAQICVSIKSTRYLAGAWGAPMLFEVHIIIAVAYNTIATPRSADVPLTKALQRDGMTFFITVFLLRLVNLVLAASVLSQASLIMLGSFFVWAAVTVVLNRSLLHVRRAKIKELKRNNITLPGSINHIASPFGPLEDDDDDGDDDDEKYELNQRPALPPFKQLYLLNLQPNRRMTHSGAGSNIRQATQLKGTWDIDW